jgi:hypothetical protein
MVTSFDTLLSMSYNVTRQIMKQTSQMINSTIDHQHEESAYQWIEPLQITINLLDAVLTGYRSLNKSSNCHGTTGKKNT